MKAGSGRRHGATTAAAGLGLALAVAVGGCAADDPREGGFIGGVMGLFSGRYAHKLETKRARLEGLRVEERGLGDEARRLEEEQGEQLAAAERRRAMAAALARRSDELDEQLRSLRRAARDAERERAEVLTEVGRLDDGELPAGPPPPAEGEEPGAAAPAAVPPGGGIARLLEETAELEERLGALQEEATRAQGERARLRTEIDRLNEDLERARGTSSRQPEDAGGVPEG